MFARYVCVCTSARQVGPIKHTCGKVFHRRSGERTPFGTPCNLNRIVSNVFKISINIQESQHIVAAACTCRLLCCVPRSFPALYTLGPRCNILKTREILIRFTLKLNHTQTI